MAARSTRPAPPGHAPPKGDARGGADAGGGRWKPLARASSMCSSRRLSASGDVDGEREREREGGGEEAELGDVDVEADGQPRMEQSSGRFARRWDLGLALNTVVAAILCHRRPLPLGP